MTFIYSNQDFLCFQLLFVYLVPVQGILEIHKTSQKLKENGVTKSVNWWAVPQSVKIKSINATVNTIVCYTLQKVKKMRGDI